MSNVIKAYSVRYDEETKVMIDTHLQTEKEIEKKRRLMQAATTSQQDGFMEGLKAVVVEPVPDSEEIKGKSSRIIEDAKAEAKRITDQAKREAQQLKNDILAEAQKNGYEEGMLQARKEIEKLKADYDTKAKRLREEYDEMVRSLEPSVARIIASLVEKITGIVVEDREEVILYLIEKAINGMDKCEEYTIRVSKDDYEYVSTRKNLLLDAIGREVPLYITEDASLKRNQCLIETEMKVIDCSLDVQLNNLITDIKLIDSV